jgi:uncharacterized protein YbjT (DUF2867 family)
MTVPSGNLVLVMGASGYVGARLVPLLLQSGYRVRCLARRTASLCGKPWRDQVEIIEGDVLRPETLPAAMKDVAVVYYFIHSMAQSTAFHEDDLIAAHHCAQATKTAGVQRIIYLGALGDPRADLSLHLRSRQDTGQVLAEAGVPVTEFRAAVILGSGSLSFELIRDLAERLPLMICPYWVYTRIQPMAVRNVMDYLLAALTQPESAGRIIEIGGEDILTYGGLMKTYAEVRKLKRYLIPVPVLTPRLSSYWIWLITPIPISIARPLIEGLRNEVIVRDGTARRLFPEIKLLHCRDAVEEALRLGVEDQLALSLELKPDSTPVMTCTEGIFHERRWCRIAAPPEQIYAAFGRLGGEHGWPALNWAWQLRGAMDRLMGGVGMRRSSQTELRAGESLDFWRIEIANPNRLLRLHAEMKMPGKAWLQFQIQPETDGNCRLVQTALFEPHGLGGVLYWYLLYPIHCWIFQGMLEGVATQALRSRG